MVSIAEVFLESRDIEITALICFTSREGRDNVKQEQQNAIFEIPRIENIVSNGDHAGTIVRYGIA